MIDSVSVIIPVYNEGSTIAEVVQRVAAVDLGSVSKEIIISDDGSTDSTPETIDLLRAERTELIRVFASPVNLGKGAAVRLGLSQATGDVIIIQDADLELDPGEYQLLLGPILAGEATIVYGSRFLRRNPNIPARTRLANRFLTALTNLLFGSRLTDMETAYKVFRRDMQEGVSLRCVRYDFEPEITAGFLRRGHAIVEVPVSYNPRTVTEGKKVSWLDGLEAVYALLRCRFTDS